MTELELQRFVEDGFLVAGTQDPHAALAAATDQRSSSDENRRKAALYVAHRARDADDARELLLALGLLEPGFRWTTGNPHGPRRKVTE